jgi:hypothetical protein
MATYGYVNVKLPEGEKLCDLYSIKTDFERCRSMCPALYDITKITSLGREGIDAFATAIPVAYARPFLGGVRLRVDGIIQSFTNEEQQFHSEILALRSKYIAHSVNGMEHQDFRVWLNPDELGRKINNVNVGQTNLLALSGREYQQLSIMCEKAIEWLEVQIKEEESSLKALVEERFSLDKLYDSSAGLADCCGMDGVNKGRSRTPRES